MGMVGWGWLDGNGWIDDVERRKKKHKLVERKERWKWEER